MRHLLPLCVVVLFAAGCNGIIELPNPPDAGSPDSGVATDGGETPDAGDPADAGEATDGGQPTDGGEPTDGGTTDPVCGNGVVETGESCDDGNAVNEDACTTACKEAACGDGYVQGMEACDDGNAVNTDACTTGCLGAECGDGYVQGNEACDDGNGVDTDLCTTSCTAAVCGDNFVQPGEACDDGNTVDGDGCTNGCTLPTCGDGVVQAGEACDDGNKVDTDRCTSACTAAVCGDGHEQPGEECDDGNSSDTDGCTNACTDATCGDGFVYAGVEECEDSNLVDSDGCTNACENARCGDSIVRTGVEDCEPLLATAATCDTDCTVVACGDGLTNQAAGEECDDQNAVDSDGCTSLCKQLVNTPPTAGAVSATTAEDTAVELTLVGADADGHPITYSVVDAPAHGSLSAITAGKVTYTPNANFHGQDTFTYKTNDGTANSTTASATVTVTAVDDVPVARDQAVTVDEDASVEITLDATEVDGDALTWTLVTGPTEGSLGNLVDGKVTYTPNADFNGQDSFTYKVNDGTTDSAVATVMLTVSPVNDVPTAKGQFKLVHANGSVALTLEGADVVDGDTLGYALFSQPLNGTLSAITGDKVTYTPNPDYAGPDSFVFEVSDGNGGKASATVALSVRAATPATLSLGTRHACAINSAGRVLCWGDNQVGQVGTGGMDPTYATPQGVNLGGPASALAVGAFHSCALVAGGTVKCWGEDANGAVGLGAYQDIVRTPTAVDLGAGRTAKSVVAGDYHTCALLDDDTVKCWGWGEEGELGNGILGLNGVSGSQPAPAGTVAFDDNGTLVELKAKALMAPSYTTCALTLDNRVYCWGEGAGGRLGLGDTQDRARPTSAVDLGTGAVPFELQPDSCVLLDDGRVKCWGLNNENKFGLGAAGVVDNNGTPGPQNIGDVPEELGDGMPALDFGANTLALSMHVGGTHGCAVMLDGNVRCAGMNANGQLGFGDATARDTYSETVDLGTNAQAKVVRTSLEVGRFSCALLGNDTAKCWGYNSFGALGVGDLLDRGDEPNEMADALPLIDLAPGPVAFDRVQLVEKDVARPVHLGVVDVDGDITQVTVTAQPMHGTLSGQWPDITYTPDPGYVGPDAFSYTVTDAKNQGASATVTLDVRAPTPSTLSLGTWHGCAINAGGKVYCWGRNEQGQVGTGRADASYSTPQRVDVGGPATALALGAFHSCALVAGGTVKCWGEDAWGAVGLGSYQAVVQTPTAVDLGAGRTAKSVVAGDYHTCALLDDDTVKCWGWGEEGELGNGLAGPAGSQPAPDGTVNYDNGKPLKAKALMAPSYATCALTLDNEVSCWGEGAGGRLGLGDTQNRARPSSAVDFGRGAVPFELQAHACALLDDGRVKCWGQNNSEKFGIGNLGDIGDVPEELGNGMPTLDFGQGGYARSLYTGGLHGCAVMLDGNVRCAGDNGNGQLGLGDTSGRSTYAETVDLGTNARAKVVRTSLEDGRFSCAVLEDDTVKCWGGNGYGSLGQGQADIRGDGPGEMGDNLPVTLDLAPPPLIPERMLLVHKDMPNAFNPNVVDGDDDVTGYFVTANPQHGQLSGTWPNVVYTPHTGYVGQDAFSIRVTDSRNQSANATIPVDVRIPLPETLSLGSGHACAVNDAGKVFCWGRNFEGQVGTGSLVEPWYYTPQLIDVGGPAKAVALGGYFSCALLRDGSVKCWGANGDGSVGTGPNAGPETRIPAPGAVNLGTGRTATSVVAGDYHACAVLDDDTVKCWGWNDRGQLGTGDTNRRYAPDATVAFADGTELKAKALSAPAAATCALTLQDEVYCWGEGLDGRTGLGDTNDTTRPTSPVDFGTFGQPFELQSHSCVQLDTGWVKCWGQNNAEKFGIGNFGHVGNVPAELGNGMLATNFGQGQYVRSMYTGSVHGCAVMLDGSVRCAGYNGFGGLGYGDTTDRKFYVGSVDLGMNGPAPVKARLVRASLGEGYFTCALLEDDAVKCWGRNEFGNHGVGDTTVRGDGPGEMGGALPVTLDLTPPPLMSGRKLLVERNVQRPFTPLVVDLDDDLAGYEFTALPQNGTLTGTWPNFTYEPNANHVGADAFTLKVTDAKGQFAEATVVVEVRAPDMESVLALGGYHACAIKLDGSVACWGNNFEGELGQGNTGIWADSPIPVPFPPGVMAQSLTAGNVHTCALMTDGSVWCWGDNRSGQVGMGTNVPPDEIVESPVTVNLGGQAAKAVAAGYAHTCAILADDSVRCWGSNQYGQLGINTTNESLSPAPPVTFGDGTVLKAKALMAPFMSTCAQELETDQVFCWGQSYPLGLGLSGQDQLLPTLPVPLGTGARTYSLQANNCALLDDGNVKCWGRNYYGLGYGNNGNYVGDQPGEMGDKLPGLDFGQGRHALSVVTGAHSTCAVLDDFSLKCVGENAYGLLGLGDTNGRPSFAEVDEVDLGTGMTAKQVRSSWEEGWFACAVLGNDTIKCWGRGDGGRLGNGGGGHRGDGPGEMGDALPVTLTR